MIPHCAGGKDSHYEEGMIIKKNLKSKITLIKKIYVKKVKQMKHILS